MIIEKMSGIIRKYIALGIKGVAQAVEKPVYKCEALSSNPSSPKQKKRKYMAIDINNVKIW
jgi:hypothetical protein